MQDELEPGQLDPGGSSAAQLRLHLVLDLDHTLVHATEVPATSVALPSSGVQTFMLEGARTGKYALRTRDGLQAFLSQVAPLARLHVYTMGSR